MATDHHGHDPHAHDPHAHGPINHETSDIHLDGVGKITIGFTVFMLLTIGVMYGTFHFFGGREAAGQRTVGTMVEQPSFERPAILSGPNQIVGARTPAGPKLLTNEPANLREFRTSQSERLHSYGWSDRAGNVVHLPIERAIALTVERGLPVASAPTEVPADVPADAAAEGATDEAASGEAPAATPPATPPTPPAPSAPPAGHD